MSNLRPFVTLSRTYSFSPIWTIRRGLGLSLEFVDRCHAMRVRYASTSITGQTLKHGQGVEGAKDSKLNVPPHSLLPTKMLLRSFLITSILSNPSLLRPALGFMTLLTKKRYAIVDVNKNPLLYAILKRTFYNHFCAGENRSEVTTTIRSIKDIGFKGVILTYAREIVVDERTQQERGLGLQATSKEAHASPLARKEQFADVEAWRSGVLDTLNMVGEGDFLALKFTGAGATVTKALRSKEPLPTPMQDALNTICGRALERNVRILVDAEQQSVQPAIDTIALELMSKYNRGDHAVVYNTYQMYLKSTVSNLNQHMQIAAQQNYILGVKIVRGAYMNSEPRNMIHDSKADTDLAYDNSVRAMLEGKFVLQGATNSAATSVEKSPVIDLFVASHNKKSALSALSWHHERLSQHLPTVNKIQYGQLLGMADEVSCGLLLQAPKANVSEEPAQMSASGPDVYKCLSWGTLEDCLSYLVRRAVENRDAVSRTRSERIAVGKELWRRSKNAVLLRGG